MSLKPSVSKHNPAPRWLTVPALVLISTLLLTACSLQAKSSQEAGPQDVLLQFLRYVPDTADYRAWVTFGDAAAWHTSWNVPRISSVEAMKELDDTSYAYFQGTMASQTIPPDSLGLMYIFVDDLREGFGFNLFDMDRYLAAGASPRTISVLESGVDPEVIAGKLDKKGYASEELAEGWTLYRLNEDNAMDMKAPTKVEQLGFMNRILLSEQAMLVGRATEVVEDALDAYQEPASSLAENEDFIASVQALFDDSLEEAGELVGVIWMDGDEFPPEELNLGTKDSDRTAQRIKTYGLDTRLEEFSLAAFGTRHNGDEGYTTLILVLVYPQDTDVDAAAQVLEDRLEKAISIRMFKPFLETLNTPQHEVYAVDAGGLPVVLATFRLEDPELKPIAEGMRPSGRVRSWWEFVGARDTMFLYNP